MEEILTVFKSVYLTHGQIVIVSPLFPYHDSEQCAQGGRGVPVSVRNLVRQATVHLTGAEEGGEGRREDEETTYKRTTVITVVIVTTVLFFCLLILVTFILELRKFAGFAF